MNNPMNSRRVSRIAIVAVLYLAANSGVQAQDSELYPNIYCDQNGTEIFTSNDTNIEAFGASVYDATLTQVVQVPDAQINIYVFNPGQIVCEIDAAVDTSTAPEILREY